MAAPLRALLLTLLFLPTSAWAQGVLDTTVALPPVTVTAERWGTAATGSARVTVLGGAAIRGAGAETVAELLERRGGLHVKRYGAGGLATLSLRGTSASQTLVLLDGHRLADPQLGQLDLSLLPTSLLEGAEVMHGAASAAHGTDGIGGAVNLRTLAPGAPAASAPRRATAPMASATGRCWPRGRLDACRGWRSSPMGKRRATSPT